MSIESLGGYIPPEIVAGGGKLDLKGGMSNGDMTETPINWSEVPLSMVPISREIYSSDTLNTAGHEFNHALAAIGEGIGVKRINLKRQGNVLGVTEFDGIMSDSQLQVIAAAGTVDPALGGGASGYGSDIYKLQLIDVINKRAPGSSFGISKMTAEAKINRIPEDIRRRATEILAYLGQSLPSGDIPGNMLGLIIKRAEWEEKMTISGKLKELLGQKHQEKDDGKSTILIYTKDRCYIRYKEDGKERDGGVIYLSCGCVNVHSLNCPFNTERKKELMGSTKPADNTGNMEELIDKEKEIFDFPDKDVIFEE